MLKQPGGRQKTARKVLLPRVGVGVYHLRGQKYTPKVFSFESTTARLRAHAGPRASCSVPGYALSVEGPQRPGASRLDE